jgi:FPC/CPF motif-containing protein YcgG
METLAQEVAQAMTRRRQLERQRAAVATVLARYGAVEGVARWGRFVLRSDEPQGYRLLYRIAERGVGRLL